MPDPSAPRVAGHPMPALLGEGQDPELVAWRKRLPASVDELLARWELEASAPFVPGGSSAWVAPVRDRDGVELVLKVAWAHEEARDEAAGMRAWQGRGAAVLHRSERVGDTSALLLERVRPGEPLAQLLTWPERDEVLVGVARRLWVPPARLVGEDDAASFRPLAHMCAWWAEHALESGAGERAGLPREVVGRGLELFRSLPAQWDGEEVLLATDLHPGNVLAGETCGSGALTGAAPEGTALAGDVLTGGARAGEVPSSSVGSSRRWVLIDPKPYVGDPHYDLLQHMLNDLHRLRAEPGRFADRMADLAGLDRHRTRRWLFARCVQEAGDFDGVAEVAMSLAADGGL